MFGSVTQVDAGAAAYLKQAHRALPREGTLDRFGLKCFENPRRTGDEFTVLIGECPKFTVAELRNRVGDELVVQTGNFLDHGERGIVFGAREGFGDSDE